MTKKILLAISGFLIFSFSSKSQLVINGATFTIESGAVVTVQGDVTSNMDIQGAGKVLLKGTANQNVNMNGKTIPNLEVDNTSNATLTGSIKIGTNLSFVSGKILTGNNSVTLSSTATSTGQATGKFIETDGTGEVSKEISSNLSSFEIPLGKGTAYKPAFVTTNGTYSTAKIGVRLIDNTTSTRPPKINDYVNAVWPVTRSGITGTVTITGQYNDADITGTEANLKGYFNNGTDWTSIGGTNDAATNRVSASVSGNSGSLTGMNKFVLVGARAFLQGAYNASNGLMNENLRTATGGNVIPNSDPYRSAPYNSSFTHVSNVTTETVIGTPFATQTQAENNIVDWVFLELRNTNASPGNTILQTRSALLQRDGDIVDVDGVSPVTFNNITDGNYAITVRHRNHLGISLNPTSNAKLMNEAQSTAFTTRVADLRTTAASGLFGTSAGYTSGSNTTLGTVNLMWAGNANANNACRYSGAGNDRAVILTDLSSNTLGSLTGYQRSDLNMNARANYSGAGNDRAYLLSNVLGSSTLT
ncbi:MAG: hypothetical protein FGM46_02590, partial [Ferruginibacter sp.]|nr:hypothetical protein [Ferruginibacter sp.]